MSRKRWTLRQRVTALCLAVGVVLTLLAAGAAAIAAQNRSQLDTLLEKTGPLRTGGEQLLTALVDQETAVRGYAVTGNANDLGPYTRGLQTERTLIAQMKGLAADQPEIGARLDTVERLAGEWRTSVAEPVIAAAGRSPQEAQALITETARRQFEGVRDAVRDLQAAVLELRDTVAGDARSTGSRLVVLLLIAAAVIVLAGVALLVSLRRTVIDPVTDLAGQVRSVARGEYDREITDVGPPELAQLARDVDAMRRQIASDLTEVRAARERIEWVNSQLQKQTEELLRSNRDLEQFAYVASHDLQEPLRKVASFCQLLQRRYAGQLDERADQYIAFAVDGAQRMQRLINDLLAFSRIGRLTAGFVEVDLDKVMGDVASQTESAREYAGGEITWEGLPTVLGEEPLLANLLVNLVSNSFKFRRPGVAPTVHISARQIGDEWEISCADNGIGIEPEFVDKIFVIFQRLHSKDAYPGTGIGLAIVKKIVEYHGGRVWVETDVAEGTLIRFTLPVIVEQEPVVAAPEQESPSDSEPSQDDENVKEVAA